VTLRVVHADAAVGATLRLDEGDQHHLERVRRARLGDVVEVLDGCGKAFRGRIIGLRPVEVEIDAEAPGIDSAPVVVALAIVRSARMDWAVEKLSELGVSRLVPLITQRVQARPRHDRWLRIARESAKQCGRARLMTVTPPACLDELLASEGPAGAVRLRLEPGAKALVPGSIPSAGCSLAIGPEGGFTAEEGACLERAGYAAVGLAGPILRSETAAIAGAAIAIVTIRARLTT